MKHPQEPSTVKECNAEIAYQRGIISECDRCIERGEEWNFEGRDFKEVIQTASDRIQEMNAKTEALAKPWEKSRPSDEVGLERFGVTV